MLLRGHSKMRPPFERVAFSILGVLAIGVCAGSVIDRKAVTEVIPPISVPYTQSRDGDDGPWFSFNVSLGSPPQEIRLFPGTSQQSIWAVLSDGCTSQVPDPCAYNRGYLFVPDVSSTYVPIDGGKNQTLDYGAAAESLGYSGSALAGYDTVSIGDVTLESQVIEGFTELFPFIGVIGLAMDPLDNDTGREKTPFLSHLRQSGLIPSLSWSYTAGASYAVPPLWGSLTLGGYDATQFQFYEDESISFDLRTDLSTQFLVGLQYFYTDLGGGETLLPTSIYANVDSLVSELWLPMDACAKFETAFNLTWNNTAQLYTVDNRTRYDLLAANPNFTIIIAPSLSDQASVTIDMSYGAFDTYAMPPKIDSDQYYFPLRRAQNASQYILGRTFLQQAILIADYERLNFSIFPTQYTNSTPELVAITAIYPLATSSSHHSSLSGGAIAGIVVGVLVGMLLFAVLLYAFYGRKKIALFRHRSRNSAGKKDDKESTATDNNVELDAVNNERIELPTHEAAVELQSPHTELDSSSMSSPLASSMPLLGGGSPSDVKWTSPSGESTLQASQIEPPAYSTGTFVSSIDGQSADIHDVLSELPGSEVRMRKWSWESGTTNV